VIVELCWILVLHIDRTIACGGVRAHKWLTPSVFCSAAWPHAHAWEQPPTRPPGVYWDVIIQMIHRASVAILAQVIFDQASETCDCAKPKPTTSETIQNHPVRCLVPKPVHGGLNANRKGVAYRVNILVVLVLNCT
jgi:hypothetical protein